VNPASHWAALKELFEGCLEQPSGERQSWLQRQTRDPTLILEVQQLVRQHEAAGDFLNQAPAPVRSLRQASREQLFESGELVAQRYRILRLLGRGGMGEVYAATDTELEETIVVKALTLTDLDSDSAEQRFRRELQLARRITHPNVCRLFDFGRHHTDWRDLLLITMELIDGRTLADELREHGPLDPGRACALSLQILDGLATAHRAGIVHRDLKPSNIMLRLAGGREEAVITDFGLAAPIAAQEKTGQLTVTGQALGTLDYMAPEQLLGQPASERTDLYAMGLVMFEMLTGSRPFPARTPLASALARMSDQRPVIPPVIAAPWRRAILACLESDASHRPACVEELVAILTAGARPASQRSWRRPSRRQLLTAAGIAIPSAACFAAFSRIREWIDSKAVLSSILLMPVANTTSDPKFDGSTLVMRNQLAQSAHFQVLGESRVAELLQEMERPPAGPLTAAIAREVALRGGAQLVVYGTVSPLGSGLTLNLQVEMMGSRPDAPRRSWVQSFRATGSADLFRAIQEGSIWIRQRSGEAEREISEQDRSPLDLTTGDWDALSRYEQGRQRRNAGDAGAAEVLFREAIQIDRGFVSAHRDLADLLVTGYRYSEGFDEYGKAIALATGRKLANWERYRLEAMYWDDAGDWEKARALYHAWSVHYPKDFVPVFYEAKKLAGLARMPEAAAKFRQVLGLKDYWSAYYALGNLAMTRGDRAGVDDAIRHLNRLRHAEEAIRMKCRAAFAANDVQAAEASAAQLAASKDTGWRNNGRLLQACLQAEQGQWESAARTLDEVLKSAQPVGEIREGPNRGREAQVRLALAFVLWRVGRTAEATVHAREASRLDANPQVLPRAAYLLLLCGDARSLATLADQARHWPTLPLFEAAGACIEGQLLLLRQQNEDAVARFRRADELYPAGRLREFLGLAYVRAGRPAEGAAILRAMGADRASAWQEPEMQWPGLCRFCIEQSTLGK
jgi:serine/threonine protein kinase/tetratricopeptide (TPR) repeat protein